MSYLSLARKYRPRRFEDLVGQESVSLALSNAIKLKRAPQCVIFTGVRGVGKTTTARIYAKALNCERGPTPEPCEQCSSCLAIQDGTHEDVLEIDGASHTGVDDVRALQETLGYVPQRSQYKIYIIDEVHMLSGSAFNALLKTIEEPPAHVFFIFATTELHKVPETIQSRCPVFHLQKIPTRKIKDRLAVILQREGLSAEDAALQWVAREGHGSLRDALTLMDQVIAVSGGQVTWAAIQPMAQSGHAESLNELLEALLQRRANDVLTSISRWDAEGLAMSGLVEQLATTCRNAFILKSAGESQMELDLLELEERERGQLAKIAADAKLLDLNRLFRSLAKCLDDLRNVELDRFVVENYCLEWCLDPGLPDINSLMKGSLSGQAPRVGSPAPVSAPSASAPAMAVAAPAPGMGLKERFKKATDTSAAANVQAVGNANNVSQLNSSGPYALQGNAAIHTNPAQVAPRNGLLNADRIAADKLAAEKAAAEKAEQERLAAERAAAEKLAAERAAAEKAERERLAAEKAKAEADLLAAEKAMQELLEKKAAAEKLAAEIAAAEKIFAEKAAAEQLAHQEADRVAAEKERIQAERIAAEKLLADKAISEKLAAERAKRQLDDNQSERKAAEKAAVEKLANEIRLAAERAAAAKTPVAVAAPEASDAEAESQAESEDLPWHAEAAPVQMSAQNVAAAPAASQAVSDNISAEDFFAEQDQINSHLGLSEPPREAVSTPAVKRPFAAILDKHQGAKSAGPASPAPMPPTAAASPIPSSPTPATAAGALPSSWRAFVDEWKKQKPLQARVLEETYIIEYSPQRIKLAVAEDSMAGQKLLHVDTRKRLQAQFDQLFGFKGILEVVPKDSNGEQKQDLGESLLQTKQKEREVARENLRQRVQDHPLTREVIQAFDGTIEAIDVQ